MDREQPLNVEIGKADADGMFRRRDRAQCRWWKEHVKKDELSEWIFENYPNGFPKEWFE